MQSSHVGALYRARDFPGIAELELDKFNCKQAMPTKPRCQFLSSMLLSGSTHSKIHFTEKQDLNILPLDQVSRPLPLFTTFQIPTSNANLILDDVIVFNIHHLKLIEARKELCPVAIGIPAIDCDESVSTKLD